MNKHPLLTVFSVVWGASESVDSLLRKFEFSIALPLSEYIIITTPQKWRAAVAALAQSTNELRSRLRPVLLTEDIGLYEMWNLAVCLADGEYVTNWNPDDARRASREVRAISLLDRRPDIAVHAVPLIPTTTDLTIVRPTEFQAPWFLDLAGEFGFRDLFVELPNGDRISRNLPHCMPVWRRNLHVDYGFFDESQFGSMADWAFWLRITAAGEVGWMDSIVGGSYRIAQQSYGRRHATVSESEVLERVESGKGDPR